jgi:hypothetical protein
LENVVELIEFADKGSENSKDQIMLLASSVGGFEVLYRLKEVRPEILTPDNLIKCFISSEVVGEKLTEAMRKLGLSSGLITVVQFCSEVKDTPTFSEIHSAMNDSAKAIRIVEQFIHGKCAQPIKIRTEEWWQDLLDKSRELRISAFEKVVSDEQLLRLICCEMLSAVCRDLNSEISPSRQAPFNLVVDLSGSSTSKDLLKQS